MNLTNSTESHKTIKSGYDLPVYGLDNGTFYYLHIPALICIISSLVCAITVIILSFRQKKIGTFFSWSKSERFIVYLAICDGSFNVAHMMDHLNYVILKDHVRPKALCEFYGFLLAEFITAQNLLVNIVAINAFMLMFFDRNLDFGKWDWKLLVWTYGLPFVSVMPAAIMGLLGPTGSYCHIDAVKGSTANIVFTTVPLIIILTTNTILYALTWKRIHRETSSLQSLQNANVVNKSHRAAQNMSLFVLVFFIQWCPISIYATWTLFTPNVPQPLFHFVTIFSNVGGCFNLVVYYVIKRRNRADIRKRFMKAKGDNSQATRDCTTENETI